MPADRQDLLAEARSELAAASEARDLDKVKVRYLGRKGRISALLHRIGALPEKSRKTEGERVNKLRRDFMELLGERTKDIRKSGLATRLKKESVDVTLPGRGHPAGSLHPVSLVTERVVEIFASMGFDVADGPEIEDDFHNFGALNHPDDHPARSMHDTFYLEDGRLLRTHTSPVQVRYLQHRNPPVRVVAPGRCYRVDNDATHSPMFHQVEGMWVDDKVRFSDLKGTLLEFFRLFFEDPSVEVRFRPSYFPFTEPSAECDIRLSSRWLEVAGCGMIHPNVLSASGVDPASHQGWAFGTGLDRLAMLRYRISDIRSLFENDLRFLRQFT